jgi:hypothetical protein
MPRHTNVSLDADTWTQLTDANVTAITFQNRGPADVLIAVTASATAPTDQLGAVRYRKGEGELNVSLASLAPGVTGTRVYAYAEGYGSDMHVSHA